RHRPARAHVVEHRQRVTQVGVPGVQRGAVAVAVSTLVPAHDAPPAGGDQRGEHVERAGEVEPAVDHEQRRRVRVAPLVGGQPDPGGVDAVLTVRRLGAWVRDVDGWHATTLLTSSSTAEGAWFTIPGVRLRVLGASLAVGGLTVAAGCADDDDELASVT